MRRRLSPQRRRRLGFAVAGWTVTFMLVAPFLWMVLGSFKTTVDFLAFPPVFVFTPTLDTADVLVHPDDRVPLSVVAQLPVLVVL